MTRRAVVLTLILSSSLGAAAAAAMASIAGAHVNAHYRFVAPPIAVIVPTDGGVKLLAVWAHLNRRLADYHDAYIEIDSDNRDSFGRLEPSGHHGDACYSEASIDVHSVAALRHPEAGKAVTVTLRIAGHVVSRATSVLRAAPAHSGVTGPDPTPYLRALGCG